MDSKMVMSPEQVLECSQISGIFSKSKSILIVKANLVNYHMHSDKDFPTVNALLGCFLIVNHVQNRSYSDFPKVKSSAVAVEFAPIVNNAKSWASLDYPKVKFSEMVPNRSEH